MGAGTRQLSLLQLAHELAHLVQRREAGFGGAFAFNGGIPLLVGIGRSAMVFMAGRGGLVSRAAMPTLSAGVNFLGGRSVPHSLEFAADAKGAALCGDPLWLARALRKLDDARPASESPRFLSTHPAVAERIRRLEAQACGAYIH